MEGIKLPRLQEISEQHREIGKQLLYRLQNKEITMAEFEKEVAYLTLDCGFGELHYKPLPSRPTDLLEYDQLSFKEKRAMSDKFWEQPHIKSYVKAKSMISAENCGTKWWLEELYNRFTKIGDTINAKKCQEKLYQFSV